MLFACSCQHMLNTFPFIQRTEQVLIELDISAIEEYVIIIIIVAYTMLKKICNRGYGPKVLYTGVIVCNKEKGNTLNLTL